MKQKGVSYDIKRLEALELLADGKTIKETAELLEVARSTVHDWIADPEYRNKVIEKSRERLAMAYPILYQIGIEKAASNAAYFKAILEHLERIENKVAGITDITITWGNNPK